MHLHAYWLENRLSGDIHGSHRSQSTSPAVQSENAVDIRCSGIRRGIPSALVFISLQACIGTGGRSTASYAFATNRQGAF